MSSARSSGGHPGRPSEIARIGGIGSLRGLHNAQNAACARPPRWRSASQATCCRTGCAAFPACAPHGAGRPPRQLLFVNDSKGTNAERPRMRCRLSPNLLDRRRQAEARRHHRPDGIFPAHPQGLSDRRGRAGICRDPRRQRVPYEISETLDVAVANAARDAAASGLPMRWCCCRRPVRRSTSTEILKSAAPVP